MSSSKVRLSHQKYLGKQGFRKICRAGISSISKAIGFLDRKGLSACKGKNQAKLSRKIPNSRIGNFLRRIRHLTSVPKEVGK
jgi:hypothetical protein